MNINTIHTSEQLCSNTTRSIFPEAQQILAHSAALWYCGTTVLRIDILHRPHYFFKITNRKRSFTSQILLNCLFLVTSQASHINFYMSEYLQNEKQPTQILLVHFCRRFSYIRNPTPTWEEPKFEVTALIIEKVYLLLHYKFCFWIFATNGKPVCFSALCKLKSPTRCHTFHTPTFLFTNIFSLISTKSHAQTIWFHFHQGVNNLKVSSRFSLPS